MTVEIHFLTVLEARSPESRCWGDFSGGPVAKILYSNVEAPGLIPGQGTRSHMLQLRVHMVLLKILHAATKTGYSQINKN